jgi:hypothetical protein
MEYIEYRDGFKYQLAKSYTTKTDILGFDIDTAYIKLTPDGILKLKNGYATDGASGPTIDTKNTIRGAFVHDALYYLIRNGYIGIEWKSYADKLLKKMLIEDGMWALRTNGWYLGVKWRGADSLYPSKEKPVLRAP